MKNETENIKHTRFHKGLQNVKGLPYLQRTSSVRMAFLLGFPG